MTTLNEILSWFRRGARPTQEQFAKTWKSFWHKSEKIPQEQILHLSDTLRMLSMGVRPIGEVADLSALNAISAKQEGDAYAVKNQRDRFGNAYLYRYTDGVWRRTLFTTGGFEALSQQIDVINRVLGGGEHPIDGSTPWGSSVLQQVDENADAIAQQRLKWEAYDKANIRLNYDASEGELLLYTGRMDTDGRSPESTAVYLPNASSLTAGLMTPAQHDKLGRLRESSLLAEYVHSGNKEVRIERIDYETNTFYSPNHGLVAGDFVFLVFGEILNFKEVCPLTQPYSDAKGFAVRNITADSFQLSATAGSAIIDLVELPTLDLTKWWFESFQNFAMRFNNIPYTNVVQVRYTGYGSRPFAYHYVSEEVLSISGYKGDQNYYGQFVDRSLLMDVIVDVTVFDNLIFRVSQLRGLRYNSAGNIEVINTRQQDVRPRNRSAVGKWLQIEQSGGIANGTAIRVYKND